MAATDMIPQLSELYFLLVTKSRMKRARKRADFRRTVRRWPKNEQQERKDDGQPDDSEECKSFRLRSWARLDSVIVLWYRFTLGIRIEF